MKALLFALLLAPALALAAKVEVTWTNPRTNTDGSALIDLGSVTVEWGACAGNGVMGAVQASVTVPTTVDGASLSAFAFPVGLNPACIACYATTTSGLNSALSTVVEWTPIQSPGQPITLGQPVILPPSQ